MPDYVMGVDVGGTKSHLSIFDRDANFVGLGEWGGLNHEGMPGSYTQLEEEFGNFLGQVTSKYGISMKQVSYSVLGMAGADTIEQHEKISAVLKKLGFGRHTLVNDSFLGIPAGSKTGTGIFAINGTGCTLAGINNKGKMLQIGGVGYVSSDRGGGSNMTRFLISAVFSELFRKAEASSMTPMFMNYLGITDKHDFVEKIYEKNSSNTLDRLACINMVFEAAGKNDPVAVRFLREVAESYAGGISTMIDEMEFSRDETVSIVLAGSVFVKGANPVLIGALKDYMKGFNPDHKLEYILLDLPPAAGAAIWALNILNGKIAYYDKVCAEFRKTML